MADHELNNGVPVTHATNPLETRAIIRDEFDLLRAAKAAHQKFGSEVWWRGHARADWRLVPKVWRQQRGYRYEQNILSRFVAKAETRHTCCPAHSDSGAWLFFAQHHGLPTRLLDWSESVLVACYFAVCEQPDVEAALWALDPFRLNCLERGEGVLFAATSPDPSRLINEAFKGRQVEVDQVLALHAHHVDARMMAQLSAFTIHGNATPLEERKNAREFLLKFSIPAEAKAALRNVLWRLGIRESQIFPDLDHLAAELSSVSFCKVDEPDMELTPPEAPD